MIFNKLVKKYKANSLQIKRLKTEFEVIKLRIDFSFYMAKKNNLKLSDSLVKYTGADRLFKYLTKLNRNNLMSKLRRLRNKDSIFELLILNSKTVKDIFKKNKSKKCFWFTIYNGNIAILHFANNIIPKNPLKGDELLKRKKELKEIAKDIKKNYPQIIEIAGVSWIRNLEMYRKLLPKETKYSEYKKQIIYSMGCYGQFYTYDGGLNEKRVKQFRKNWKFPLKEIVGESSIKDFFKMYLSK